MLGSNTVHTGCVRVCVRGFPHKGILLVHNANVHVMLVVAGPSMLQACRVDRAFSKGIGSTAIPCRVLRPTSSPRYVVVAATQTGLKSLVKNHGAVSVQGTSRKRNEDRYDLQA